MKKIYVKQVSPESQEDDLFYNYKDKETGRYTIGMNDEFLEENTIIDGNSEFMSLFPKDLEDVRKHIEYLNSDLEGYCGEHENITTLANCYFKKYNGKRWSKKELKLWNEVNNLYDNYSKENEEKAFLLALFLITGKKWTKYCIKGCSQRDWQYIYVSEEVKQKDIEYIECCYFNTGTEWLVYNNKENYNNDESDYTIYISGYTKKDIADAIGQNEEDLIVYKYDSYHKVKDYCLI